MEAWRSRFVVSEHGGTRVGSGRAAGSNSRPVVMRHSRASCSHSNVTTEIRSDVRASLAAERKNRTSPNSLPDATPGPGPL